MVSYTEQMELIEEIFNLFDTDGQQQLDEEELASAIFALGFSQHGHVQVIEYILLCSLFQEFRNSNDI